MKKTALLIAVLALLIAGCGSRVERHYHQHVGSHNDEAPVAATSGQPTARTNIIVNLFHIENQSETDSAAPVDVQATAGYADKGAALNQQMTRAAEAFAEGFTGMFTQDNSEEDNSQIGDPAEPEPEPPVEKPEQVNPPPPPPSVIVSPDPPFRPEVEEGEFSGWRDSPDNRGMWRFNKAGSAYPAPCEVFIDGERRYTVTSVTVEHRDDKAGGWGGRWRPVADNGSGKLVIVTPYNERPGAVKMSCGGRHDGEN